jgi:hypothetical protein
MKTSEDYTIYAALTEEENEGWVWFSVPTLRPRTVIKVRNPHNGRSVFCLSRQIDPNFLGRYNNHPRKTINEGGGKKTLAINAWYRDALGALDTQTDVCLEISTPRLPFWRDIRAACHHPDIVARVGTRLGLVGAWLGMVALSPVILELSNARKCVQTLALLMTAAISAVVAFAAARGVNPH